MDEKLLGARITRAVDSHCAHLRTDPDLARRVIHQATRKEPVIVKRKTSVSLALALILMLLTATAVAAVLLTGRELVEQEAVPRAQQNDSGVRPEMDYTYEELQSIILVAQENGITLDDDSSIMRALRQGEGYNEEETIMALCREAFGGLFYEWTTEEKHWFEEMMISIGWATENPYPLPGEGELTCEEARALSVRLLRETYGADLPLDDRSLYRVEEWYYPEGDDQSGLHWSFIYRPRFLDGSVYYVNFDNQGGNVWHRCDPWEWGDYTEATLLNRVDHVYNYVNAGSGMITWDYDAWYAFGQKLAGAVHSATWNEEYDGYAASTYLLPGEGDLTKKQARQIAFTDAGVNDYTSVTEVLLGSGEQRVWKISFVTTEKTGTRKVLSYEIDSQTGGILRMDDLTDEKTWARYMLFATYETVRPESSGVSRQEAIDKAIAALRRDLNDDTIPYDDPDCYTITATRNENTGAYWVRFDTRVMEYGRASVDVDSTGTVSIKFANAPGLDGDNLFSRFTDLYGADMDWEQSRWVEFGEAMKQYEPTSFEGKLFKQTTYLPESAVTVTRDQAMDIAYLDSGKSDINRIVLIDAQPHPVWKVRVSTWPVTTLYEIDAMTGDILDKELYFIQEPNFDHTMKMYTLRSVYMPAALAEFGVKRIAMELCTKAYVDDFVDDSADRLMSGSYRITVDGMTVSFMAVDPRSDSYIVTVAEDAMSAAIELIPGAENTETLSTDEQSALYALFEGSDRFQPLEELPEPYQSIENDYGPIEGEMTLAEAQAHAFALLVDALGQETVDGFGKFAVGYRFTRFQNDGNCIRWTFLFVSPEDPNCGYRVTFALRDNELWGDGQVQDVNDLGNG